MIRYSYNKDKAGVVFAGAKDINASFKDLCAVCDSIRGRQVTTAMAFLDMAEKGKVAVLYKRHNRYMGDRHELGGKKGRWPKKCASFVKKVLVNATANARNIGEEPDDMMIIHVAANKTQVIPRRPPKGIRGVRTGGYGYSPVRRSDMELARIEIGLAYPKGVKRPEKKAEKKATTAAPSAQKQEAKAIAPEKKAEQPKTATAQAATVTK